MKYEMKFKKSNRKEEELMHAIRAGSTGLVKALIDENVDIDYDDGAPLYLACLQGNSTIADLLIQEHADIELGDYQALKFVIRRENLLILDRIMNNFDSIISDDTGLPCRPLRIMADSYAKKMGKIDVVEHLNLERTSKNDIIEFLEKLEED